MLEAAAGALWSGARGWLTPPVLFVLVNLVIGTIAVMSRLMSSSAGDQRSLKRAPSRLRCFSFSRLGLPDDHAAGARAPQYPAFDDDDDGTADAAASSSSPVHPAPDWGEWRRMSLLRGFSFSRRGDPAPVTTQTTQQPPPDDGAATDAELLSSLPPAQAEAGIERSQSEAAPLMRRPRARRTRADGHGTAAGRHEPPAVEVDARADDFIRQFREQLRLQRLDSALRRTGTI